MPNSKIIVNMPNYIQNLHDVLGITSNKSLANYLLWRMIYPKLEWLPRGSSIGQSLLQLQKVKDHVNDFPPSNVSCVSFVTRTMPYAVGRIYVQQIVPTFLNNSPPKQQVQNMIRNIIAAFGNSVKNLNWMDARSKANAQGKVNALIQNVAFPDWILRDSALNAYYSDMIRLGNTSTIKDYSPWQWFAYFDRLSSKMYWRTILNETNRHGFNGSPATVNAWYYDVLNSITFPQGILQTPFYDPTYPEAWNYGGIGVVMGHELSHAFDDVGVQFGSNGTIGTWMDGESTYNFTKIEDCVINEYNNFCYGNLLPTGSLCIIGGQTQGENVADNGGIKAAFHAYENWVSSHGPEPRLPNIGTQFTMKQLFFLSFAQVWCRNIKDSALVDQILTNAHSPARYRVIGTVQNFPEFAKAFNCPFASPMYPTDSCNVW